ncbi:hypothetical protein GWO09_29815 [candidate division KSB1 bacterium]|nr:hypothetical protein [candidate division KSB1 bacterium]
MYNKDIERLLLPINEETFVPMNNGRGYSRGLEFIFEKKPTQKARFSGILSYAFGNAKFRSIDSDEWLPFKYDRRHALSVLSNVRLFGNWNLSILGQFSTGYPFTDVLGLRNNLNFFGDTSFEFERGARFQTRFPAFKKIDARLSYRHRVGGKAFSFYVDVINITNERNVYEITWEKRYLPDDRQQATKRVIYMLPIIPSLGVSVRL